MVETDPNALMAASRLGCSLPSSDLHAPVLRLGRAR
jgi:hypothetical protein